MIINKCCTRLHNFMICVIFRVEISWGTKSSTLCVTNDVLKYLVQCFSASWSPSKNYELMRRKTENDVTELWYFISHKLNETKEACEAQDKNLAVSHISSILNMGTDMHRFVLYN